MPINLFFSRANVESFEMFSIENMKLYILKDNHRSSNEIINVLNHMRKNKDFEQSSPTHKSGNLPTILVGAKKSAYHYLNDKSKIQLYYHIKVKTQSPLNMKQI